MRRLALLTAASLSFSAIPYSLKADTGSVELSNGQESSLKDDVIFKWYINGQTQGAGVPNSFGIGSLRPFAIQSLMNRLTQIDISLNFSPKKKLLINLDGYKNFSDTINLINLVI